MMNVLLSSSGEFGLLISQRCCVVSTVVNGLNICVGFVLNSGSIGSKQTNFLRFFKYH